MAEASGSTPLRRVSRADRARIAAVRGSVVPRNRSTNPGARSRLIQTELRAAGVIQPDGTVRRRGGTQVRRNRLSQQQQIARGGVRTRAATRAGRTAAIIRTLRQRGAGEQG